MSTRTKKVSNMVLLPIIFCIGFLPLIVHWTQYETGFTQFDWFQQQETTYMDMFLVCKMIFTALVGFLMLFILIYFNYKDKKTIRFTTAFYLLFIYALFVILSAFVSPYKHWVFMGSYEMFEPIFTVITYLILCYYCYYFVREEKQVYFVLAVSAIGIGILLLIGACQSFGNDLFDTKIGSMLVLSPSEWGEESSFNKIKETAYATLYNQNYVSLYASVMIALFVGLLIAAKRAWKKALICCVLVFAAICLWGAHSSVGPIAVAFALMVCAVVLLCRTKKGSILAVGLVLVGICGVAGILSRTEIKEKFKTEFVGTFKIEEIAPMQWVETGEEGVTFCIQGNPLTVSYDLSEIGFIGISCCDELGNKLPLQVIDESNMSCVVDDDRFREVLVRPFEQAGEKMVKINYWKEWTITKADDGVYRIQNYFGRWVHAKKNNASRLFNDDAMSFRGWIWNNTIPLLSKHLFLGSGANTFVFEFPQDDEIWNTYYGTFSSLDVKAHNWYLQQWVEEGFLALLCVCAFIIWYFVDSIRLIRKADLTATITWIGIGLFAAMITFMVGLVVNDVMAGLGQVLWGLLGMGWAVNRIIKEKHIPKDEVACTDTDTGTDVAVSVNVQASSVKQAPVTEQHTAHTKKKQSRRERKGKKG